MVNTMTEFATITAYDETIITLAWNEQDGYVYADNEKLDCDGVFDDIDNACETMERLYRNDEWNFTRM